MQIDSADESRLFTEQEAALLLKMTPRMLAKRRYDKKIRYIKDGHFIVYKFSHLVEYLVAVERGTGLEVYLSDTSELLDAVRKHLSQSVRAQLKHR